MEAQSRNCIFGCSTIWDVLSEGPSDTTAILYSDRVQAMELRRSNKKKKLHKLIHRKRIVHQFEYHKRKNKVKNSSRFGLRKAEGLLLEDL